MITRICIIYIFFASSFSFGQSKCIWKTDSMNYYIFEYDSTKISKETKLLLRNYTKLDTPLFFQVEDKDLVFLDSVIFNRFNNSNTFISLYNFSEYSIQLINIKEGEGKITYGHFNLNEQLTDKEGLCYKIRIVFGGGSSFISFAYDWETNDFIYFYPNNIR